MFMLIKEYYFYSENSPLSGNPWSMEGIEKDFLSPWICELACMHILVETEVLRPIWQSRKRLPSLSAHSRFS